jgi:hypothetical protein
MSNKLDSDLRIGYIAGIMDSSVGSYEGGEITFKPTKISGPEIIDIIEVLDDIKIPYKRLNNVITVDDNDKLLRLTKKYLVNSNS